MHKKPRVVIAVFVAAIVVLTLTNALSGCKGKSTSPTSAGDSEPSCYIGNVNTEVFHRPSCVHLPDPANRVTLNSCSEALNDDYRRCSHCDPC
jgi:hypothetical protein